MQAPGSQSSLREANSQRIVDAVRTYGAITQVELAAATGLSAATVSNIVKQLEADGVLATSATTRSGRRAQQVSLAPSSSLGFGVHIGRRALAVHLADVSHTVRLGRSLPLPDEHRNDTTLDRVALLAGELATELGAGVGDIAGVGVALPDVPGHGVTAAALRGWESVDVADTLERWLRRPVLLARQADAAAVAEARLGALRGSQCALYVRVGETVEASLLLEGHVHHGAGAVAGALGHVQVDPSGIVCRCGARGCLDTLASAAAMADLLRVSHGPVTLRQIIQMARTDDPGCRTVVRGAGAAIGTVVANAATLLGVDRIVVGGELVRTGDLLLDPIRSAIAARPLLGDADTLLAPAQVIDRPEAVGAAVLALDAFEATSLSTTRRGA